MIAINNLKINAAADSVNVRVTTTTANRFTKILVWNEESYKDYSLAIDITTLIAGVSNVEDFSVSLLELQLSEFKGLIIFEFTTNETTDNVKIGAIANLTKWHNCLTNKLLAIDIRKEKLIFKGECKDTWSECKDTTTTNSDCTDCNKKAEAIQAKCNEIVDDCGNSIFYLNALLSNIHRALICVKYDEAVRMLKRVKEISIDCCTFGEEDLFYITAYISNDSLGLCVQAKIS